MRENDAPGRLDFQAQTFGTPGRIAFGLLLLFTAYAIWAKWGKLDSLLWLDPAWWLNEYGRYARGELLYRDFYWAYGPLSADIFGWPLRWFGARFSTVQAIMDIVSLAVVFLVYKIARRLVPSPLAQFTAILLIAVGITARSFFSLFSLISYTPAVQVAAASLLLMMWAAFEYIDSGRPRTLWIALGAWGCCLSKQETIIASLTLFALLAIFDSRLYFRTRPLSHWLRRYISLGLICFAPPVLVYFIWANRSGWEKFLGCMQAFGIATMTCPWWPTGFGITGILVELGEAWIIIAVGSIFVREWRALFRGRYWLVWLLAVCASAGAMAFSWGAYRDLLAGPGTVRERIARDAVYFLSSSAILRPILAASYFYGAALLISALRKSLLLTKIQFRDLLLVAMPCAMGMRSIFGSMMGPNLLEAPAIDYPFLLLVGPYLLYAALTRWRAHPMKVDRRAVVYCSALVIGYSVVRLAGGYPVLIADKVFPVMETPAGPLRLKTAATEKPILDYVLSHTNSSDTILELPFGGGMSFATGRREPTYSTIFSGLRPPMSVQQEDLSRISAHPPAVVIARSEPNFGSLYGYPSNLACAFPRFVWQPTGLLSDPTYVFPVISYIQRNYDVDRIIGEWILLRPRSSNLAARK